MALAEKLYYLMLQSGVSQIVLSEQTKIERTTLTRILNGTTEQPKLETIISLANFFKVDISEFLDDNINLQPSVSIQIVLRELMRLNNIPNSFALSKQTNLPRSAISGILSGKTQKPKIKTLQVLSEFFKITILQLCGVDKIYGVQELNTAVISESHLVPILEIDEIKDWITNPKSLPNVTFINVNGENISNLAYAIKIKDNKYFPDIMLNNILIADKEVTPSNNDLVICELNNRTVSIFEQISVNSNIIKYREAGTKTLIEIPLLDVVVLGVIIQKIINRI